MSDPLQELSEFLEIRCLAFDQGIQLLQGSKKDHDVRLCRKMKRSLAKYDAWHIALAKLRGVERGRRTGAFRSIPENLVTWSETRKFFPPAS